MQIVTKDAECFVCCRLAEFKIKLKDDGKSFVWQSFGRLMDKSGKRVNCDQIYCARCFDAGKLKSYRESVSTTNLAQHLCEVHGILYAYVYSFILTTNFSRPILQL